VGNVRYCSSGLVVQKRVVLIIDRGWNDTCRMETEGGEEEREVWKICKEGKDDASRHFRACCGIDSVVMGSEE